jgi:hypothetical protein
MNPSTSLTTKYFDLHTSGIGYLNRIREVPVRRGNAFMACDIAALHGAEDDVEYTHFDCKVSGGEAERLIRRCQDAVIAGKKVLLAFRIGDLWIDTFVYGKGDKAGQPGASLKGRLLYIAWIRIDGQQVYQAAPRSEQSDEQGTLPVTPEAASVPCIEPATTAPADDLPDTNPAKTRRSRAKSTTPTS